MRVLQIKETEGEVYKNVKFDKKELKGDFVDLISSVLEKEDEKGRNGIFYTNIGEGGTELKNRIVKEIDRVIEAGFVSRKNGKCYFRVVTEV